MVLATLAGGYAGADSTGQAHIDYPANTYILPVMCPVMFPPEFFIRSFERGIDAIIVMYSGTDSPYQVEASGTATLINKTYTLMKQRGIAVSRLKLTTICTVCRAAFLKEIAEMEKVVSAL